MKPLALSSSQVKRIMYMSQLSGYEGRYMIAESKITKELQDALHKT